MKDRGQSSAERPIRTVWFRDADCHASGGNAGAPAAGRSASAPGRPGRRSLPSVERRRLAKCPPFPSAIAERAQFSGAIAADETTFVRKLRSGERPLTRDALAVLVRSQLPPKFPRRKADVAVRVFMPLLHAAHQLTVLMPSRRQTSMRLDRTGWRAAYLTWWERHARRTTRPRRPPTWLRSLSFPSAAAHCRGYRRKPRQASWTANPLGPCLRAPD